MSCTVSKRSFEAAGLDGSSWTAASNTDPCRSPSASMGAGASSSDTAVVSSPGATPKRSRLGYGLASAAPVGWSPPAVAAPSRPITNEQRSLSTPCLQRPIALAHARPTAVERLWPDNSTTQQVLANLDRYLPRRKRALMAATADDAGRSPVVFTLEEVREMLEHALRDQEDALQVQFQYILKDKLNEQFENFSKFNQDYVSRQLRESHYDYTVCTRLLRVVGLECFGFKNLPGSDMI